MSVPRDSSEQQASASTTAVAGEGQPNVTVDAAATAQPTAGSATQSGSLAEACGTGRWDDVVVWMQRLAPPRTASEVAAAAADNRPFWFVNATDGEGRTAFHWAVAQRQLAIVNNLLSDAVGCNPATTDAEGCTRLLTAVSAQAPLAVVKSIIAAAPDAAWINAQDGISGNTALHAAASRATKDVVSALLEAGANPLLQSRLGQTALHKTIPRGATEVAEMLISHVRKTDLRNTKRFVNLQDENGDTALHHCSAENNREFGELLLRHGADRVIKNKAGLEFWQIS
jgi:hypothetical protein